jgi:hypothetical protein
MKRILLLLTLGLLVGCEPPTTKQDYPSAVTNEPGTNRLSTNAPGPVNPPEANPVP